MAIRQIQIPDIGNFKDVSVIEVAVKAGDAVKVEEALITLETDKAAMDVTSPFAGVVKEVKVKVGDKVSQGSVILLMESDDAVVQIPPDETTSHSTSLSKDDSQVAGYSPPFSKGGAVIAAAAPLSVQATSTTTTQIPILAVSETPLFEKGGLGGISAHASPAIRRFARELGVDLAQVEGSGEKGRVTKDDVQSFVKRALAQPRGTGLRIAEMPSVDFAQFGPIETRPLPRIRKISGANLHRNWVSIPHVTQFEEADITEMEAFRKQLNEEYAKQGIKITPLAFLLRAVT